MKNKDSRGVTLVEVLLVVAIIAILSNIAMYSYNSLRHTYVFQQYASTLEISIKRAKSHAMERSSFVSVCVKQNEGKVEIRDAGADVDPSSLISCERGSVINIISIDGSDLSYLRFTGGNFAFDPRGFAHFPTNNNYVCLSSLKSNKYVMVCPSKFGAIMIKRGNGSCPATCL